MASFYRPRPGITPGFPPGSLSSDTSTSPDQQSVLSPIAQSALDDASLGAAGPTDAPMPPPTMGASPTSTPASALPAPMGSAVYSGQSAMPPPQSPQMQPGAGMNSGNGSGSSQPIARYQQSKPLSGGNPTMPPPGMNPAPNQQTKKPTPMGS